eukprot:Mycagemm_TRINITY_DN10089_c0_g1::TRINITY_DN10089_c0_g1_i1::g.2020::m.2020 type:complete len:144 gc:universal TRINITY_DN10089_c0_g1_i1:675-1106(+)
MVEAHRHHRPFVEHVPRNDKLNGCSLWVPNAHSAVLASCNHLLAVNGEPTARTPGPVTSKYVYAGARCSEPHPRCAALCSHKYNVTAWVPCEPLDPIGRSFQSHNKLARGHVPDFNESIEGAGSDKSSIKIKSNAIYRVCVPL